MNKVKLLIAICIFISVIAGCSNSNTENKLVGIWQDTEAPIIEMEFTASGRFIDYFNGEVVSSGNYSISGSKLVLEYTSGCIDDDCLINLRYTVTDQTLIITDAYGDIIMIRVK